MINWFEKHFILSWIVTFIIAVGIFYMSSRQFQIGDLNTNFLSIFYHFFTFFFFSLFFSISLLKGKFNKSKLILVIILSIIYGISDEFHQSFVPGRYRCFEDILINTNGILAASIFYTVECIRKNDSKKKMTKIKKINLIQKK